MPRGIPVPGAQAVAELLPPIPGRGATNRPSHQPTSQPASQQIIQADKQATKQSKQSKAKQSKQSKQSKAKRSEASEQGSKQANQPTNRKLYDSQTQDDTQNNLLEVRTPDKGIGASAPLPSRDEHSRLLTVNPSKNSQALAYCTTPRAWAALMGLKKQANGIFRSTPGCGSKIGELKMGCPGKWKQGLENLRSISWWFDFDSYPRCFPSSVRG